MSTPEFQVAIIGCGAMGGNHAANWAARDDARVATVYDPDADRCRQLAAKHQARACQTPEQALSPPEVNCASICVPVCHHRPMTDLALRSGCHVICEKPIALTLADAQAMIACAREEQRQLAVGYQYRTQPGYRRARDLVQAGELGAPLFGRFIDMREVRPKLAMHGRTQNGGPLVDMAGHFFDLMAFLTGGQARKVFARGHVYGRGKPRLATVEDLAIDAAEVLVEYEGGHTLSTFVNWGMPEGIAGHGDSTLRSRCAY